MAGGRNLDLLAIAAHPDDAEITCGGLLIKMAKRGRATGVLDLTQGEMGTRGDSNDRAREAADAAEILGLKYRGNSRMPDSAVESSRVNKLTVAQIIRDTRPATVILPHWIQRHPDHLACTQLAYDACFLAGLNKAQLDGDPHRPTKILYVSYFRNTDYSFLVDISDEFDQKVAAVAAYISQFGPADAVKAALRDGLLLHDHLQGNKDIFHPGVNIFDLMQTRARQLGQLVGVKYAEAYTIKEHLLIDNPLDLAIRSI
ncbi:MAG: bacillithiol biosynthesis deacetylase BshB1 [Planctomycetota bacterium]